MSRHGSGYTIGQLMVAILVGAVVLGLCLAVDEAVRRRSLTDFPAAPPPSPPGKEIVRGGYGDK